MTGFVVGRDRGELHQRVTRLSDRIGAKAEAFMADRNPSWIVGTVDEAIERLGALRDAGVSRVMCQNLLHDDLDVVALIGSELRLQLA